MEIRRIILAQLQLAVEEFTPLPFPSDVDDDMLLDEFRLDSVAFTNLLVGLEQQLGFIPSGMLRGIAFPETVGEFIEAYESEAV